MHRVNTRCITGEYRVVKCSYSSTSPQEQLTTRPAEQPSTRCSIKYIDLIIRIIEIHQKRTEIQNDNNVTVLSLAGITQ